MSDALRRLYNNIDQIFDRQALGVVVQNTHRLEGMTRPVTATQALQAVQPSVYRLDRDARLKMIVSQSGLQPGGVGPHWEFFLDMPRGRAQVVCQWRLSWDESRDDYGAAVVEIKASPFPRPDSPIRQLVREGKLLHRQMISLWHEEQARRPDLPRKFRDSDQAYADLLRQGLDPAQDEFSLSTGQSPQGRLSWVAQSRRKTYYVALV